MKTRKNLMILVLLSLFVSVGVADSNVTSELDFDKMLSTLGVEKNSSTGLTEEEMDNLFNLDDSKQKALDEEIAKIRVETAKIRVETANKLKVADALDRYSKAGDF